MVGIVFLVIVTISYYAFGIGKNRYSSDQGE